MHEDLGADPSREDSQSKIKTKGTSCRSHLWFTLSVSHLLRSDLVNVIHSFQRLAVSTAVAVEMPRLS